MNSMIIKCQILRLQNQNSVLSDEIWLQNVSDSKICATTGLALSLLVESNKFD